MERKFPSSSQQGVSSMTEWSSSENVGLNQFKRRFDPSPLRPLSFLSVVVLIDEFSFRLSPNVRADCHFFSHPHFSAPADKEAV